ncbi:MAG: deoxyribose-phosphate aldolase [Planctomycetota bacterium]
MTGEDITAAELAALIDHAVLRAETTREQLTEACRQAARWKPASVCVRPCDVAAAVKLLGGSGVSVSTVVAFPHGSSASDVKAAEARLAVADGADELDMVVNVGLLCDERLDEVRDDIAAVVAAAEGRTVKVILECCLLNRSQKVAGCRAAFEAAADFVKTSTGFASGGATADDVRLLRECVGEAMGVKAAGGVRTLDDCLNMLNAGASRLGTSRTFEILAAIEPGEHE